ncbi:hypothetical protein GJAV_G00228260 [Gymnothorax javanicus]|nr:hypothetical protein GJAV_G00228260 [Gymnothorax javanicus]
MAALLRGLRAGRVLRAVGCMAPPPVMVTPKCSRLQRGLRQAARLRLQDDSKSDQLLATVSSPSSPTHQQPQPCPQETDVSQHTVPESESPAKPTVDATAHTPVIEISTSVSEETMSESESAAAHEFEASKSVPEQVVPELEQVVPESVQSPASAPVQEISESVSGLKTPVHTPEVTVSAPPHETVSEPPSQVEASESVAEEVSTAEVESPTEGESSEPTMTAAEQEAPEADQSCSDQDGEESDAYETEEELQARILSAALEFVPLHGWTVEAIADAAQTLGLSSAAAGMFTNGAGDLVLHFISQSNTQLAKMLAEHHSQVQQGQEEPKDTAEFLRYAVEARLRMLIPYVDSWPQAMSILLLPHNIPYSLKHLSTLIDDIWYYAGDRSTDMNWYTRRAALTGVYNTTELVMLQDSSPDFQDTWLFLDRRIQDIINMADTAQQVQATGEAVVQGIMGAAVTLSNIAGMNQLR